ncbi:MAG: glycosyl hydrolase [Rhodospirillales bacterium]
MLAPRPMIGRSSRRGLCAAAVLALAGGMSASTTAAATVEARRAAAFTDMFGVVTHVSRATGVLADADDDSWPVIRDAIVEAGFRHLRTTLTNARSIPRVQDLAARGLRFSLRIDTRPLRSGGGSEAVLDPGRIAEMLEMAKAVGVDAILAFEGPNEYNANRASNADWAIQLKAFMAELAVQVRADPDLADKPIVAPSIWRRKTEDYQAMADLGIGEDTTRGNLHNYNAGRPPGYQLSRRVGDAQAMTPGQPVWVTEYGYRTHGTDRVSEAAKAKYLARYAGLLFDEAEVERASVFQIVDEWLADERPEKSWGLLDNTLVKRPAFFAVRNTLALLADPDGDDDFVPGGLDFDLLGDLTDVHSFLVQKRSGAFYLVIWQEVDSYDRTRHADLFPPERRLRLTFGAPVRAIRTYLPTGLEVADPEDGQLPRCVIEGASGCRNGEVPAARTIDLWVPDELLVVEIETGDPPVPLPPPPVPDPPVDPKDDKAPTAPGGLTADLVAPREIRFTWAPSRDNVGVDRYTVYDGSHPLATTAEPAYTLTARKDQWYVVSVSATDAAGNESARSEKRRVYVHQNRLISR